MTIVALRIFIFTFLPLLLAAAVILLDASVSSRERRLEVFLMTRVLIRSPWHKLSWSKSAGRTA
jgi:hypothetical protein